LFDLPPVNLSESDDSGDESNKDVSVREVFYLIKGTKMQYF